MHIKNHIGQNQIFLEGDNRVQLLGQREGYIGVLNWSFWQKCVANQLVIQVRWLIFADTEVTSYFIEITKLMGSCKHSL